MGIRISTDEPLDLPAEVRDFASFRRWTWSDEFPERGRIDWLAGRIEAAMSPEELYTHSALIVEIAARLHALIIDTGLGLVFSQRTRFASPTAELSVEPDVVAMLWASSSTGRVHDVPSPKREERYIELEGAPDLVVEVVSDSSVGKDRKRLPPLYAAAGVPELWLVDARRRAPLFQVLVLEGGAYREQPRDEGGWMTSPLLGRRVRLVVRPGPRRLFRLEHEPAG